MSFSGIISNFRSKEFTRRSDLRVRSYFLVKKYGKIKVILATILVLIGANTYFTLAATLKLPPSNLGLVGYWTMDEGNGSLTKDLSGNGNNGTLISSPTWVSGKLGNALNFSGANYVEASTSNTLSISGNQITVSVWVKPTAGDYRAILSKGYSSSDGGYAIRMTRDSEPTKAFFQVYNAAGTIGSAGTYSNIKNGVWSHLIGTYDGSQVCFYVNGVLDGSCGSLTGNIKTNSLPVRLGKLATSGGTTEFYVGSIDDARVYNRAISASEIKQLYSAGVAKMNTSTTNKNTSGLIGYWTFDGADTTTATATDKSGNGNNGTLTNGPTVVTGKIGQALKFTGSNIVNSGTTMAGTWPALTISAWVNPSSAGTWRAIVQTATTGDRALYLQNNYLQFYNSCNSTGTVQNNKWTHVTVTIDGSDVIKYYINGVASGGCTVAGLRAVEYLHISGVNTADSENFQGKIDDARVYNRALSATEIKQLYNTGAGNQVNSTQNSTQSSSLSSGLIGYWSFNGPDISGTTAYDRSGSGNNGTLVSSPTPATGKVGQALMFNGSNKVTLSPVNPASFVSVTGWFKRRGPSTNTHHILFMQDTQIEISIPEATGQIRTGVTTATLGRQVFDSGSGLTDGKWHFLSMTYDGSNLRSYIDGVQTAVNAASGALNTGGSTNIGYYTGYYANAYIDEVRVYNRAISASEIQRLYLLGK